MLRDKTDHRIVCNPVKGKMKIKIQINIKIKTQNPSTEPVHPHFVSPMGSMVKAPSVSQKKGKFEPEHIRSPKARGPRRESRGGRVGTLLETGIRNPPGSTGFPWGVYSEPWGRRLLAVVHLGLLQPTSPKGSDRLEAKKFCNCNIVRFSIYWFDDTMTNDALEIRSSIVVRSKFLEHNFVVLTSQHLNTL